MKRIIYACILLLLGGAGGVLVSIFSLREKLFIDYDSGRIRREIAIGPLLVREQRYISTLFYFYPVGNRGRVALTGNERWEKVSDFTGFSMVSPDYEAAYVYGLARRLEEYFPYLSVGRASELKEEFLIILNQDGVPALDRFVSQLEMEFLEKEEAK